MAEGDAPGKDGVWCAKASATNMTDISVIILTKNEKLHIRRCLEKLAPLEPRQIFVVDCFSTDGTQEIVKSFSTNHYALTTNHSALTTNHYALTTNHSALTTNHSALTTNH